MYFLKVWNEVGQSVRLLSDTAPTAADAAAAAAAMMITAKRSIHSATWLATLKSPIGRPFPPQQSPRYASSRHCDAASNNSAGHEEDVGGIRGRDRAIVRSRQVRNPLHRRHPVGPEASDHHRMGVTRSGRRELSVRCRGVMHATPGQSSNSVPAKPTVVQRPASRPPLLKANGINESVSIANTPPAAIAAAAAPVAPVTFSPIR